MVLFNNVPYKCMRLTNKVNLTKHFSEKYTTHIDAKVTPTDDTDYNCHIQP